MMKTVLSTIEAKKIALKAQLLDGYPVQASGKAGVAHIIDRLGYLQIDTISVIKRSHHHTLWLRHQDYHEEMLHDLQAKDFAVFEYWTHAMSYLPISDFRYYLPRMRNFADPKSKWAQQQVQTCQHLFDPILERIRKEGPLSSKDFEPSPGKQSGTWWDWKPAKSALELLFWRGDLMIRERKNFHKIYDLTERVLPAQIDTTLPEPGELGMFWVRRALSAFGLATERQMRRFLQPESSRDAEQQIASKELIVRTIQTLVDANELIPVTIEDDQTTRYYTTHQTLEQITTFPLSARVNLLSPFDNLIIQRDRAKALFGLDYTLECYVPEEKRMYGYFVLPILWGTDFVGWLDPKADRKQKTLVIINLNLHADFRVTDEFLTELSQTLIDLAHFNECENIELKNLSHVSIKSF